MTRSLQRLAAGNEYLSDTPSKSLTTLAKQIDGSHQAFQQSFRKAVHHVHVAGGFLIAAKKQVLHGDWENWVEGNTNVSIRTASNYMRQARYIESLDESKRQRVADLIQRRMLEDMSPPEAKKLGKAVITPDGEEPVLVKAQVITPDGEEPLEIEATVITPEPEPKEKRRTKAQMQQERWEHAAGAIWELGHVASQVNVPPISSKDAEKVIKNLLASEHNRKSARLNSCKNIHIIRMKSF